MDPQQLQQIEQYLRDSGLNATELRKRMEDVKNSTAEFNRELKNAQRHFAEMNTTFSDLSQQFKNVVDDLTKIDSRSAKINKSFKVLGGIADKLKYDYQDISILNKKDLQNLEKKARIELSNLKARKAELELSYKGMSADGLAFLASQKRDKLKAKEAAQLIELNGLIDKNGQLTNDTNNYVSQLLKLIKEREEEEKKINRTLGISGKIVDGIVGSLNKLGVSSDFFENLKEDMREAAKSGDKWKVVTTATKGLIQGIGQALKDPVTQLTILLKLANFFVNAALTANAQSVELGKQLGYGADRANRFRENLADIESSTNNLNVTTKNLVEAYSQISQATGFAYEFTADQLTTQIKLTKQVGLQADEAAQIQRFSILTGKTSEETYRSFVRGLTAARNQLRVGINFKAALAEASKISGQLAANLGNNPEMIAKAVVTAKAFGMTLEQVAAAGDKLLDFGGSIESELKAELLLGRQINLERARAAALAGDQVTLTEELAKNVGTAAEFTKLNRLQQNALAESVGMTSDQLAETLRKREEALASGKSLVQVQEEEARKALERQNVQDKFNAAIEKLQSIFGNLMAGPLGSFIDMLSQGLNIINSMMTPLKIIGGLYLAHAASKKIALGYDIAMNSAARINQSVGQSIAATNLVKNQLEKQSLLTRMAGNVQLFRQLTTEHGLMNALKIQFGLQEATNVEKGKGLLITTRDFLLEKGKVVWMNLQKAGMVVLNTLKSAGALITKREAVSSIASAAMSALKAAVSGIGSFLGPLAIPLGLAAAAGVAAAGYQLLRGDDVMSEGGYGKRTLLAPEGAIKLNDKDTVLAGTDLGSGDGGGTMPSIDLTPMIAAINEVRAAVDRLYNKDTSINMDGKKVGSTLVQGSYKAA